MLLDALARQSSVVGAAAELHITQPVVTRSLHELEDILGVQLFERGPRGITPTVFGEAFYGATGVRSANSLELTSSPA
ncbi:LysR family transcriptional regulator [Saccharopolyspora sp. ASAGF58]|uniref:helix-turn-helix domain-containing protein n=1 Tax=Saccharopolyspora sp. ASAGF58 TaxID=2719023 RepID=UPI001FF0AEFB|nr:LysR family transcriptional regulator [Saccharopolyspora sp. ASAGF58]